MAIPLVAGCCAVLRETLGAVGVSTSSGALIKALLVNGADDLGLPRSDQGFGRVNIKNSLVRVDGRRNGGGDFVDVGVPTGPTLEEGQNWTQEIPLAALTQPGTLKVTLAYPDRQGAILQNNLTLKVEIRQRSGNIIAKRGDERVRSGE
ncbi:telomere-associated RecQ helicase [Purpureocillium lavendulum]|uniref:Telomere-associated RecQ helicase n=1 Tax=Purpureocillium lavendulum TaxID=1247861 RepID=A0AB34FJD3_9HYPO|nr:telomere-associated RecQ helicase [Purpureocillium lavendulum]